MQEKILILDFGGQYNQLIARRVRECRVYCELHPYTMPLDAIRAFGPSGIIFTGGPNSVYAPGAPQVDPADTSAPRRRARRGNTARRLRTSTRPAACSPDCRRRASLG